MARDAIAEWVRMRRATEAVTAEERHRELEIALAARSVVVAVARGRSATIAEAIDDHDLGPGVRADAETAALAALEEIAEIAPSTAEEEAIAERIARALEAEEADR